MDAGDVKRVAIIGAGTMGHGIARTFARAGYQVSLSSAGLQFVTEMNQ